MAIPCMQIASTLNNVSRFLTQRIWLTLLLISHLPFVALYFVDLWHTRPHYQFFPFAIGGFVWLAGTRRCSTDEQWTKLPIALIAADLFCVGLGIIAPSPWLFATGMALCVLAWCLATKERGYERRLTYLGLLPLMTIRLPVNWDGRVIVMLQTVTTEVASMMLQRFGLLHVRTGNVLEFPGKRFLIEEACSGIQSLFTILFIGTFVICWNRRALAHGIILLATGILFASVMNVCRVIAIAVAWDRYAIDLSVGIQHDMLGYLCLGIAAVLLLSADSFLTFLTDPVPNLTIPGHGGDAPNPLIVLWNHLFSVRRDPASLSQNFAESGPTAPRNKTVLNAAAGLFCCVLLIFQGIYLWSKPQGKPSREGSIMLEKFSVPESQASGNRDSGPAEAFVTKASPFSEVESQQLIDLHFQSRNTLRRGVQ